MDLPLACVAKMPSGKERGAFGHRALVLVLVVVLVLERGCNPGSLWIRPVQGSNSERGNQKLQYFTARTPEDEDENERPRAYLLL
jgi:hypothetical protein